MLISRHKAGATVSLSRGYSCTPGTPQIVSTPAFRINGCGPSLHKSAGATCILYDSFPGRTERINLFFDYLLDRLVYFRHELYNRIFIRVLGKNFLEGFTEYIAHIAIDINFAYTDLRSFFKVMPRRPAATMQADITFQRVTNTL